MNERSISPFEFYGEPQPETDAVIVLHEFRSSDTLSNLANLFYGDWQLWRDIAERNDIVDVRQIDSGTTLVIPQRPLEKGLYESK